MPGATATDCARSLDAELNPRVAAVRPSKTMLLTDLARSMRESGIDVIGLAAGEPDFDTPAAILEAGQEALRCAACARAAVLCMLCPLLYARAGRRAHRAGVVAACSILQP